MQEYGVNDEVRRLNIAPAHNESHNEKPVLDGEKGLIRGVSDNFEAHLSIQKQTHSLASVLLQNGESPLQDSREELPRLKKSDLASRKRK